MQTQEYNILCIYYLHTFMFTNMTFMMIIKLTQPWQRTGIQLVFFLYYRILVGDGEATFD
jgi:hypothetical protein